MDSDDRRGREVKVLRLGFFLEFSGATGPGLSMREAVRKIPAVNEDEVVNYLRTGLPVIDVMERRLDVLDGSAVAETGSILTDGQWYWREDLAHYVAKYHLDLDRAFLAGITNGDVRIQELEPTLRSTAIAAIIEDWQRSRA